MTILYVTPIFEVPPAGGPQLRVYNSILALSRIVEVRLYHIEHVKSEVTADENRFLSTYCESYSRGHNFTIKRSDGFLNWFFSRSSNAIMNFSVDKHVLEIEKLISTHNINIVWFSFGNISYKIIRNFKKRNPKIKIICDTDSVWSRYILRGLKSQAMYKKPIIFFSGIKKVIEERKLTRLSNIITAVSEIDASYYEKISNKKNVRIFPNVIDIEMYKCERNYEHHRKTILLTGSYSNNPSMIHAADWLTKKVLPLVKQRIPGVKVVIVGKGSEYLKFDNDDVITVGFVDSMIPFFKDADVCAVPLFFESGTRFKIMEAGATGLPIVSTTLGAEGLDLVNEEHVMIADTPEAFANSVIKTLTDNELAKRLSENCHRFVCDFSSLFVLEGRGRIILKELDNG
jgi:polysaccharide biosynthesis protein PslH